MFLGDSVKRIVSKLTFNHVLMSALILRVALIFYGEYQDAHSAMKYTDIDYRVFSDAARYIVNPAEGNRASGPLGKSIQLGDPYTRATYRYTPLLALVLTPNERLHATFGKFIFAIADVLIGVLLQRLLASNDRTVGSGDASSSAVRSGKGLSRNEAILAAIWLLNPMPANISTRGSAESVLGLMVIGTAYSAMENKWDLCAFLFGLSVHWKIYPIIYAGSLVVFAGKAASPSTGLASQIWTTVTDTRRIRFILISSSTFLGLSSLMWLFWGHPFLEHAYLYHVGRTDHRHNFSLYFYPLYLGLTKPKLPSSESSSWLGLVAFVPQMTISLGSGLALSWVAAQHSSISHKAESSRVAPTHSRARSNHQSSIHSGIEHLPFILFIQTLVFVTLNKVCTSQYFMWYLWFLPLVIPRLLPSTQTHEKSTLGNGISARKAVIMTSLWVGAQALWLSQGYRLEFLGQPVFQELWVCGATWLLVNAWLVDAFLTGYSW